MTSFAESGCSSRHWSAGRARLTLHVPVTPELKSWILSLGGGARVLRPKSLNIEIFNEAMAIAQGAQVQM